MAMAMAVTPSSRERVVLNDDGMDLLVDGLPMHVIRLAQSGWTHRCRCANDMLPVPLLLVISRASVLVVVLVVVISSRNNLVST